MLFRSHTYIHTYIHTHILVCFAERLPRRCWGGKGADHRCVGQGALLQRQQHERTESLEQTPRRKTKKPPAPRPARGREQPARQKFTRRKNIYARRRDGAGGGARQRKQRTSVPYSASARPGSRSRPRPARGRAPRTHDDAHDSHDRRGSTTAAARRSSRPSRPADRKSTRLNSSHSQQSRMPSSA